MSLFFPTDLYIFEDIYTSVFFKDTSVFTNVHYCFFIQQKKKYLINKKNCLQKDTPVLFQETHQSPRQRRIQTGTQEGLCAYNVLCPH